MNDGVGAWKYGPAGRAALATSPVGSGSAWPVGEYEVLEEAWCEVVGVGWPESEAWRSLVWSGDNSVSKPRPAELMLKVSLVGCLVRTSPSQGWARMPCIWPGYARWVWCCCTLHSCLHHAARGSLAGFLNGWEALVGTRCFRGIFHPKFMSKLLSSK